MNVIFVGFVVILGAIIGSFLNVVIARYNTGMSFLSGRSMCFSCGKTLVWYELIPVVSFLAQRGRCRSCTSAISRQYLLVELFTAAVFVAVFLKDLSVAVIAYHLMVFSALVVIGVYDFKHKIIPDGAVYFFITLSFVGLLFVHSGYVALPMIDAPLLRDFVGGPLIALPFAGLWYFSKGAWIGFGDAKLALGMGWFLGLEQAFFAVTIASWIAAAVGIVLIALGKIPGVSARFRHFTAKSEIAFGPFLIIGTLAVFFFDINPLILVIR